MQTTVSTCDVRDSPRAWLVTAAAFIVGFVVFGILYSFGSFFEAISRELDASNTATSAFFAIIGLAFYFFGPVCGYLGDRFGARVLVSSGAVLVAVGLILTSRIETIWAGSPLVATLIADFGWRESCVLVGCGSAVLLFVAAAMVRPAPLAAAKTARSLGAIIHSGPFVLLYVSWICATTALFIPFVFLPEFARQEGATPLAASMLLSLIGVTSVIGRLGFGMLASRIGTVPLFKAAVMLMAASYVLWLTSSSYVCLVIFSMLLGLGYGVRIALMPEVLIVFFGVANLGALLGIFFTSSGIAAVLGPLVAAIIVDHVGHVSWGIVVALVMGCAGFIVLLPLGRPAVKLSET